MDSIDDVGIVAMWQTASTVVGNRLFCFGFYIYSIQRKVLIDTEGKSTIPPEKWRTRGDQVQKKYRHTNDNAWLRPIDVMTRNK